ncbi:hypothetical protein [Ruania zhangjianzhongii]|uniref:hypothetical protein n=1 Tax=Ruania zhangjianzhongii TaxID=2603206 RepID=UPI0011CBE1C3|nr:hypothetical protein [Ruania zhangjianzhongii]
MTRSNDEDPLQRLRAADPAAGSSAPDHRRIRAAVDRRLAETGRPSGAAPEAADRERAAGSDAGRDELSGRRRRRQPLRYAAAAVGAVLLLGGGYAAGSGTGGLNAGSTADVASGESQAEDAGPEGAPDLATPEPGDGGDSTSGSGQEPALEPQRTVFTAGDLPEGPAQAPVYSLGASASETGEQAARLAAALELAGDPEEENGTWVVGGDDGDSATLRLHPAGLLEYADPGLQGWDCQPVQPQTEPDSPTSSPQEDGQSAAADCADVPAPPDAAATFAAFLTDAGLDAEQYEIRTDDSSPGASVTATLRLGELESDLRISATIVPDGIAAVGGTVATPADLGEYPLISPTEAVERLMDPRFTGSSDVLAVPDPRFTDRADGSSGVVAVPDPRFSGPAPSAGSPVPWPVRQVEITTAELTLVSVLTSTGVLVLPTYQLTGTDTGGTEGTWTVPALTEDDFDFTG